MSSFKDNPFLLELRTPSSERQLPPSRRFRLRLRAGTGQQPCCKHHQGPHAVSPLRQTPLVSGCTAVQCCISNHRVAMCRLPRL